MKKIIRLLPHGYKDRSIKVKLLTITSMLIVSSVLVVSFLSYYKYTLDFEQQAAERTQQTIEQLSYNIETYLDDVFRLSVTPYYNDPLMQALEQPAPDTESARLEKRRLIERILDNMMVTPRNDILSVYIISDEIYRGGRFPASINTDIDYRSYAWYQKAMSTDDTIFVPAHTEQIVSNPKFIVFSIVKGINSIKHIDKKLGVIKVDADYSGIKTICNKVNMGKDGGLFIIDENDTIIFSNIASAPFKELYNLARESKKPFIKTSIDGKRYLLNSTLIPSSRWSIIAFNSLNELNRNAIQTRNITFLMALACSSFAVIILLIFTNSFLKPLFAIIKLMKEVKRGNFQVEFPLQRNDEIGYLGSSFNTMVSRINHMISENEKLVKEIYEAKFLQKEAQISALYSQIRPHFIYNTLNMISLLIQCGRNNSAIENINKLSSLLRGMAHLDKEIRLETELELLDSYLSIQSSRYDGRLEYDINIDKSLYSYTIPALIFQPVVENCVVHGCEKRKEKTIIKIYNEIQEDYLVFYIEDNADGINEAALESLRIKVYSLGESGTSQEPDFSAKGNGIGLVNVNKRIKIKFGAQYGLVIDSTPGKGTCVKILLPTPASREEKGNV